MRAWRSRALRCSTAWRRPTRTCAPSARCPRQSWVRPAAWPGRAAGCARRPCSTARQQGRALEHDRDPVTPMCAMCLGPNRGAGAALTYGKMCRLTCSGASVRQRVRSTPPAGRPALRAACCASFLARRRASAARPVCRQGPPPAPHRAASPCPPLTLTLSRRVPAAGGGWPRAAQRGASADRGGAGGRAAAAGGAAAGRACRGLARRRAPGRPARRWRRPAARAVAGIPICGCGCCTPPHLPESVLQSRGGPTCHVVHNAPAAGPAAHVRTCACTVCAARTVGLSICSPCACVAQHMHWTLARARVHAQ